MAAQEQSPQEAQVQLGATMIRAAVVVVGTAVAVAAIHRVRLGVAVAVADRPMLFY